MLGKDQLILVVDDIGPARQTILNILNVLGYKNTIQAADGRQAWEQLESHENVGLVISDWKMPQMSGIELLARVRSDLRWKNLPFFLVTSKSESEDVAQATDIGATGYMVKPLNLPILKNKLETLSGKTQGESLKETVVRAGMYRDKKDLEKAKTLLFSFLKENPDFESRICLEIGLILEEEGLWAEAERISERALKQSPEMSRALFLKARMQGMQGKWEQSIKTMQDALNINPRNAEFLIYQGTACLHLKNLVQAKSKFMTALNIYPKDMDLKQTVWNTYLKHGLVEQVQIDFGAVLFESLTPETLNNMAIILRKKNMLRDALLVYKQALKKDRDNPRILYNIASAYSKEGNKTIARKYLQKALEIKPDFNEALQLLENLDQEKETQDS